MGTKRALKRWATIALLFLSEMAIAVVAGGAAAALLLPVAYQERGYTAVGGEWGLILLAAVAGYYFYHNWLFYQLERLKGGPDHEHKYSSQPVQEIHKVSRAGRCGAQRPE